MTPHLFIVFCECMGVHVSDTVGVCHQVNEPDNTVAPVEILKVDDANEVAEDEAPIKHGVNGDVEGVTSGGSEGADLDLADQTLVEDLSQDADSSVIREVTVGTIPLLGSLLSILFCFGFNPSPLFFLSLLLLPHHLFFGRSGEVVCSFQSHICSLCDRTSLSKSWTPTPRGLLLRTTEVIRFLNQSLVSCFLVTL